MYLEIRYFYFIWKSDKTVCSRRGQFPLRGKGKGPLAQRPLPLRPPPETWGTPPVPHTPSWHKGAGLRSLPFGNPSREIGPSGAAKRNDEAMREALVLHPGKCSMPADAADALILTRKAIAQPVGDFWIWSAVRDGQPPVLGELTASPVKSSLSVFSFVPCPARFLFGKTKRKCGGHSARQSRVSCPGSRDCPLHY